MVSTVYVLLGDTARIAEEISKIIVKWHLKVLDAHPIIVSQ